MGIAVELQIRQRVRVLTPLTSHALSRPFTQAHECEVGRWDGFV
jgi:hypothetical protein